MQRAPSILNVHTPSSSFAIIHSLTQEGLDELYDKLSRKGHTERYPPRVGPGWLRYEWGGSVWNLDDDSDYTIFAWRQQQEQEVTQDAESVASTSRVTLPPSAHPHPHPQSQSKEHTPTLHLHNPSDVLPQPPTYCNPSYYIFREAAALRSAQQRPTGAGKSGGKGAKGRKHKKPQREEEDGVIPLKRDFEKFHSQNGVRTIMGSIGPVENVRMLLKMGHKHVYMSRKFAIKHGFIPPDSAPGNYGYGGIVTIGYWPITIQPSASSPQPHPHPQPQSSTQGHTQRASTPPQTLHPAPANGLHPVLLEVFLDEEPHFDVVLGRSFWEKRSVKVSNVDMTEVWCMDVPGGEKIECEVVVLKDGRGEIVTVT
ncbi:hypothetical protein FA13DRAFT_1636768 [Coprinellus micaceus]|uniref:Uncharacterized protein n=1 Tax=Coprinellus micaceus TaxID=71717 RepID=A0A4Y7SVN3_COPMI|nr:hypothetical protein FA13DRAFT_1636768 [Coprinellus micaceus]